jgi:hypothetical protein
MYSAIISCVSRYGYVLDPVTNTCVIPVVPGDGTPLEVSPM